MAAQATPAIVEGSKSTSVYKSRRTRPRETVIEDEGGQSMTKLATSSGGKDRRLKKPNPKPMERPPWFTASESDTLFDPDLTTPEDLIRKMDEVNLTEEETEELLKKAYEINRQLKSHLVDQNMSEFSDETSRASVPQALTLGLGPHSRLSPSDRPRSRGTLDDDILPQLPQGRDTALSSGMYSRTSSVSPPDGAASPSASLASGSAQYTSYPGAQVCGKLTVKKTFTVLVLN